MSCRTVKKRAHNINLLAKIVSCITLQPAIKT